MTCSCGGRLNLRKKRTVSRQVKLVFQCEDCLKVTNVPKRLLRDMGPTILESQFRWIELTKQRRPNARKREYLRVLRSARWKRLRKEVLERDEGLCQIKGWGCTGRATEVHHLTYERFGQEQLEDLQAACRACNSHERQERLTRHVLGPVEGTRG